MSEDLPETVHGPFNVVERCRDCGIAIPINSPDPQAIGRVYCPNCGQPADPIFKHS